MNGCLLTDIISNHGINILNPDCEYENLPDCITHFNSEMRTIEDDLEHMRGEILEENEM